MAELYQGKFSGEEIDSAIEKIEATQGLPAGGTEGQVVTKTVDGAEWKTPAGWKQVLVTNNGECGLYQNGNMFAVVLLTDDYRSKNVFSTGTISGVSGLYRFSDDVVFRFTGGSEYVPPYSGYSYPKFPVSVASDTSVRAISGRAQIATELGTHYTVGIEISGMTEKNDKTLVKYCLGSKGTVLVQYWL